MGEQYFQQDELANYPECVRRRLINIDMNAPSSDVQLYAGSDGYYTYCDKYFKFQEQSNWCWVAAGVILGNYRSQYDFAYAQTTVYNEIKRTNCPYDPQHLTGNCNQTGSPGDSMRYTSTYRTEKPSSASLQDIVNGCYYNQPIVAVIQFSNGLRHCVIIHAIVNGTVSGQPSPYIGVLDTAYGKRVYYYSQFPASYNSGSQWVYTYFSVTGLPV